MNQILLMDAGQMIGLTGCHGCQCHAGPGEGGVQRRELIGVAPAHHDHRDANRD